jgi:hypothetical protein
VLPILETSLLDVNGMCTDHLIQFLYTFAQSFFGLAQVAESLLIPLLDDVLKLFDHPAVNMLQVLSHIRRHGFIVLV